MIHQYKNNGYNIVLDVNSGSVHVVDEVAYDVIAVCNQCTDKKNMEKQVYGTLTGRYPREELTEALADVRELMEADQLFSEDVYEPYIQDFKERETVVKALCIHITHDCNLACKYCFAGEGEYHGSRALMSVETGKKALDFLVANSGNRTNLEVDFFGGEPLMNWETVKELVAYGRSLEKPFQKKFRFTLTTNGVLLDETIEEFLNREMSNVVLSIDGRKQVHDSMRPTKKWKRQLRSDCAEVSAFGAEPRSDELLCAGNIHSSQSGFF